MKKFLLLLVAALFITSLYSNAQLTQDPKTIILKPTFVVGDVIFAYNIINTIDIQGTEVEPFLECRDALKSIIDDATKQNMQPNDNITTEIKLTIAQNLSTFLSRGKFKGENAANYKRFMDALVKSAEEVRK